jgi:hypothetical protein
VDKEKVMRFLAIGGAVIALSATASAQTYVHGYTKKDGTHVAPHYRSNPDGNPYNNWSTKGNVNPYTGQAGTRNPYSSPYSSYGNSYGSTYNPYGSSNTYGNSNSSYGNTNPSYGYSNPYSSTSNRNGSSATCHLPPC